MHNNSFKVSSLLSMGASDGPGIRFVMFVQGCPLRCDYCHNPETWDFNSDNATVMEIPKIIEKIRRCVPYFSNGGGVTVSGGEPLSYQEQIITLFTELKKEDIHTCIDTSAGIKMREELLECTDLLLVDIKFLSKEEYIKYTEYNAFDNMVDILHLTKKHNKPIWIRHVLYPGVTDNEEYVLRLKEFCKEFTNIERIELLPFKNICTTKYEDMGMEFKMKDITLTDSDTIKHLKSLVKNS